MNERWQAGKWSRGSFQSVPFFLGFEKKTSTYMGLYSFFLQFYFSKKKKSEANMLNVSICKTWVTCEGILLDPFLYFSLYLKIFDDCS